jgi:hypothetical protein
MSQNAHQDRADGLSLTDTDLADVLDGLAKLSGKWSMLTESGDEGEFYARVMPPWGDGRRSAFLLERERDMVILTDNLSDADRCLVFGFPSAAMAMAAVQKVIRGN